MMNQDQKMYIAFQLDTKKIAELSASKQKDASSSSKPFVALIFTSQQDSTADIVISLHDGVHGNYKQELVHFLIFIFVSVAHMILGGMLFGKELTGGGR